MALPKAPSHNLSWWTEDSWCWPRVKPDTLECYLEVLPLGALSLMWLACHTVVQVLRSCQQCCWWIKCSGVWCCVAGWVVADIAEGHSAFIFRVTLSGKIWRLSYPPKYWELCMWSHSVIPEDFIVSMFVCYNHVKEWVK